MRALVLGITLLIFFVPSTVVAQQRYNQQPLRRVAPQVLRPQALPRQWNGLAAPVPGRQLERHFVQPQVLQQQQRLQYLQQRQQQTYAVRQDHSQKVQGQAYNHRTGNWEQHLGYKLPVAGLGIAGAAYGYIWYSSLDYDGAAYVELPGVGFVEFDGDDRYPGIVADLISGDPDRMQSAINLIEGSAMVQGLMEAPDTEGEGQEGD